MLSAAIRVLPVSSDQSCLKSNLGCPCLVAFGGSGVRAVAHTCHGSHAKQPCLVAAGTYNGEAACCALNSWAQTHVSWLQVAFEGVGSMPMERINSYRARKQREVDREMAARETRVSGCFHD